MEAKLLEISLLVRNGRVFSVNQPPACRVSIYDYDTDRYEKDRIEPDPKGKPCVATIWIKYPYNGNEQVRVIHYEVVIGIRKQKVCVDKCPKEIRVVIHEEETEKKRKK